MAKSKSERIAELQAEFYAIAQAMYNDAISHSADGEVLRQRLARHREILDEMKALQSDGEPEDS
jgi:hypothetical protein